MEHIILFGTSNMPLKIGSKSFICYVLENKQRVITTNSLQKAVGYDGKFENWLFEFLSDINAYQPISFELLDSFEHPIKIINPENNNEFYYGFDSKILAETCQVLLSVKNDVFINASQIKFSKEATYILENLKSYNIEDLIDEATGFNLFKKSTIEKCAVNLKVLHDDHAFIWLKTFPDSFFEITFEMKSLHWKNLMQNQQKLDEIINEIIFYRIDGSLIEELRNSSPKRTYKRKKGKKQELEHPKLKEHIAILLSIAKVAGYNWNIFIQLLNKSFPKQTSQKKKGMVFYENKQNTIHLNFDEKLKKSLIFKSK